MLKKFSLAFASLILVVACSKQKKQEGANTESQGQTSAEAVIEEKPIGFDAMGSDSGKIDGLNTIFFDYDTATIQGEAKRLLTLNGDWLKKNPKATLQIEGHCDERGSIEYNLALGERRAKSVKSFLTGLGIDGNRLTIISYGEEKPLSTDGTEASLAKNRRANFVPLN